MPEEGREWVETLPADVQGWKEVKDSPDADAFYQNMGDMRARMGNSLTVPGEDAGQDAMSEFYGRLVDKVPGVIIRPDDTNTEQMAAHYKSIGRPEEFKDYGLPEGVEDSGTIPILQEISHGLGLSPSQYNGMVVGLDKVISTQVANSESARVESVNTLREEWGAGYDRKHREAVLVAKQTGAPPQLIEQLESGKMGADTLKWVAGLAGAVSGKPNSIGDDPGGASELTKSEVKTKQAEIRANKAYWEPDHPDHKRLVKRMQELALIATPAEIKG